MVRPKGGNPQQITLTGAAEDVVLVSGKRATISVVQVGCTYDIVAYTMSAAQATERGLTRQKHVLATGLTDASYQKSVTGPYEELGAEVTAFGTSFVAEVMTSKW